MRNHFHPDPSRRVPGGTGALVSGGLASRTAKGLKASVAYFAAAALIVALPSTPNSYANPNDERYVATRSHIDAPKVYWDEDGNTFTLQSEVGRNIRPIEDTVNWLGKGYHASRRTQQYMFTVPEDPNTRFLGEPGTTLLLGPAVPGSSNEPLWAGFGADAGVPVEQLRDGSFNLDIVGFNGPGRMEQFNYIDDLDPPERLFSSHDPAYRSSWLIPGTHTHNQTTFTKPGLYEITYRATARDLDGNFIASKPQVLRWQVGGRPPSEDGIGEPRAAYDAATGGVPLSAASLTLRPHEAGDDANDGDDQLTDIVFDAGDPDAEGTVAIMIDGFFLTDLPVSGGKATWPEMIGDQTSNFQAVFIPKEGSGKARWVSAPLEYNRSMAATTQTEQGEYPQPHTTDPAPSFELNEFTPSSRDVQVSVSKDPDDEDKVLVNATPADDSMTFHVIGGYYKEDAANPTCLVDFISSHGVREAKKDRWGCDTDEYTLKLRLVPHARAGVGQASLALPNSEFNSPVSRSLEFGEPAPKESETPSSEVTEPTASESAKPSSEAAPSTEPSAQPNEPTPAQPSEVEDHFVELHNGHLDVGPRPDGNGGLEMVVKDDTREHAKKQVIRDPEKVALMVPESASAVRGEHVFADPSYDFLGDYGTKLWVLPQVQVQGLVWPGFSTEALPTDEFPNGATLMIEPESAPEGSKWWAFTSGLGQLDEVLASSEGPVDLHYKRPSHVHVSWAMTKPGIYKIKMGARATDINGKEHLAEPKTVEFRVGDALTAEDPTPEPSASESETQPSADATASEATKEPEELPAPPAPITEPAPTSIEESETEATEAPGDDDDDAGETGIITEEPDATAAPAVPVRPAAPGGSNDKPEGEHHDHATVTAKPQGHRDPQRGNGPDAEAKPESSKSDAGASGASKSNAKSSKSGASKSSAAKSGAAVRNGGHSGGSHGQAGHESSKSGGRLASTGANVATVALIALALMSIGAALYVRNRRRSGE